MFHLFGSRQKIRQHSPILLHNSATRTLEEFQPLKDGHVSMYTCGPTVYDHIHIGNLRAYLLPDILHRLFLYHGYRVEFTINFTDFGHLSDDGDAGEDKMMKGMKREGLPITLEAMRTFAKPYIESFKSDTLRFGNLPVTSYARASDYIKEQIKLIETLEEKGYTYETSDGVYFDITSFPAYGTLGSIELAKLQAGARVAVNAEKKNPADFALWKKGELGWKSKWGQGFPGWHIECTAMVFATLSKQIDIHTGGEDLMYTHHNGEIAQAECATGKQYVRYWLHNAHVTIGGEKIAKSAGNGIRLNDLSEDGYDSLDFRYWLLTGHYRTTMHFTYEALDAAKTARLRLRKFMYEEHKDTRPGTVHTAYEDKFLRTIQKDLDTPGALAILWELIKDNTVKDADKIATIQNMDAILGIGLSDDPEEGARDLGYIDTNTLPEEIQTLIDERTAARVAQNWTEADRLREALRVKGYELEDSPDGTKISKI